MRKVSLFYRHLMCTSPEVWKSEDLDTAESYAGNVLLKLSKTDHSVSLVLRERIGLRFQIFCSNFTYQYETVWKNSNILEPPFFHKPAVHRNFDWYSIHNLESFFSLETHWSMNMRVAAYMQLPIQLKTALIWRYGSCLSFMISPSQDLNHYLYLFHVLQGRKSKV